MKKSMQQFPRMLGHVGIGLYTASVVTLSYFRSTEITYELFRGVMVFCGFKKHNLT